MRAYIRETSTRFFYSGWDDWCFDFRRALSFPTVPAAEHAISHDQLKKVEIVLIEPALNLQIPFSGSQFEARIPPGADEPEP